MLPHILAHGMRHLLAVAWLFASLDMLICGFDETEGR